MGVDKKSLVWEGTPFMTRAERLASSLNLESRLIVEDVQPGCGPLGGVLTALESSGVSGSVFIPIDMPLLTSASLGAFLETWVRRDLPHFTRHAGRLGFPFAVTKCHGTLIRDLLLDQKYSLWMFAEKTGATWVDSIDLGPEKEFTNVNTMDEYNRLSSCP